MIRVAAVCIPAALVALGGALGGLAAYSAEQPQRIEFPAGYAQKFTNYVSSDRLDNPDQAIRIFGNEAAIEAGREGRPLPNGSILVAEVYKAKLDQDGKAVVSSLGRRIRDKFAAVAVMQKIEGFGATMPEELRTGDWDFALFSPAGERLDKDLTPCRSCHAPLTESDFVFSIEHLRK